MDVVEASTKIVPFYYYYTFLFIFILKLQKDRPSEGERKRERTSTTIDAAMARPMHNVIYARAESVVVFSLKNKELVAFSLSLSHFKYLFDSQYHSIFRTFILLAFPYIELATLLRSGGLPAHGYCR